MALYVLSEALAVNVDNSEVTECIWVETAKIHALDGATLSVFIRHSFIMINSRHEGRGTLQQ